MKSYDFKNKKFLLLFLFSYTLYLTVTINSYAMANPSAVYCSELGYQYTTEMTKYGETGYCIFPDGIKCNAWDYYMKCHPEPGNNPSDFHCSYPCKKAPCVKEGKLLGPDGVCCDSLKKIYVKKYYNGNCSYSGYVGYTELCSNCGNGVCETWESKCSCPEDCNIKINQENDIHSNIIKKIKLIILILKKILLLQHTF